MLTIVDLERNEELSSSSMGKVAGGMSCEAGKAVADIYDLTGSILHALGDDNGAMSFHDMAYGIELGACG
jgi:hypothetical protein